MATMKPLPAEAPSKLVPQETQINAEEWQHMQAIAGGNVRRVVGTSATLINNFVHWFQAISDNMHLEAQRKALAASRRVALLVFTLGEEEN